MATIYVRSTDGNNADDGSTWALSKSTLAGADGIDAAGDTIYVSQSHSESTAATVSITWAGTLASPTRILCGNDAAEPPTALSTAGVMAVTGANRIDLAGVAYTYGMTFKSGGTIDLCRSADGSHLSFDGCTFDLNSASTTALINFGNLVAIGNETSAVLRNCKWKFGNTAQAMRLRQSKVKLIGCSFASGSSAINTLFAASDVGGSLLVEGCDLSGGATAMNLFATSSNSLGRLVIRNCKLPSSWSGALLAGAPANMAMRAEMHNCDSGDTNYRIWVEDYAGSIKQETTIVRTGGASDGTTALSWKMVTGANASYPTIPLESPEIVAWNETTGSSVTATVEVLTDNVTLTDAECWLEVEYLGTSGVPLAKFANDSAADVLATPANQTTSTETWTTTGLTTPVKQKLAVTFTPQEKGYLHARVFLAKASATAYVDPKLTVA